MIKHFFIEPNLHLYLNYFHMDFKKFMRERMMYGAVLFLLCLMGGFSMGNSMLYAAAPIGFLVGYKINYLMLYNRKSQADIVKSFIFPQFLRTFLTLLASQGNIHHTLIETEKHINEPIKSALADLIKKTESNNDYAHYIEFSDFVGSTEAQMVMSMIHSFSEYGVRKEELDELERMIERINLNKMDELIRNKANAQEKYSGPTIFLAIGFVLFFAGIILVQNLAKVSEYMSM